MSRSTIMKPVVLALLIAVGLMAQSKTSHAADLQTLTVAGGCFWCVEADFEKVKGVKEAVSGYSGGATENPTYKQVSKGGSGHYEAVQITFDADQIDRETLLSLFIRSVDPTDAHGQFCDRGESYRTAIFVSNSTEKSLADKVLSSAQTELGQTIVTPVLQEAPFYPAEKVHQNYYKSQASTLTRFGYITRERAYKRYRAACGRDARVKELWGDKAPFVGG